MKKTILAICLTTLCATLKAQENPIAQSYADQVSPADLKEYLSIIASDALEGRKTGTRGQKMAAAFIADHFRDIGLSAPVNGSYYQPIELFSNSVSTAWVKVAGTQFSNFEDILYFGTGDSGGEVTTEIVFAGRGAEEDYKQLDVKGKAVVVLTGKITGLSSTRKFSQLAAEKGAKIIFIATESTPQEFQETIQKLKGFATSARLSLERPDPNASNKGTFVINQPIAEKLFNTSAAKLKLAADDPKHLAIKKIKPANASYRIAQTTVPVNTENVIGYLEGTDKKDEVVLVTAHFDHIGIATSGDDRINNGADDDGSGTVSVLEIAKTFAKAKKEGHGPRRSMVFMTVVGEEQGLLGSEYYVTHPVYALANTVVDLNIDMIGRNDPEHKGKGDYVYVIGSDKLSMQLHQLNENMNKTYTKLALDYTYNDENHPTNLYKRSDHWNFAKNGIPIIFYFDGIHEDYHKPSDEIGKIDFDLLAKRAKLVFYDAWEVANRDDRIVPDKK